MKKHTLVLLPIVILSSALAWAMLTNGHDWGDDFAGYIMQASSIVHGTAWESAAATAFTMQRSSRSYAPIAYPWGFPTLLAPFLLACGDGNIFCLKSINVVCFALLLAAFFPFLTRRLPLVDATLVLSVLAFSPVLLPFQNNVLSDIPFLFFSTLSVLLIEHVIVTPEMEGSPGANVWLGVVLFVTSCVRLNGILLVPTLFLTQAVVCLRRFRLKPNWRKVVPVAVIPYVVFGLLTVAVLIFLPSGEASYAAHFRALTIEELTDNLSTYAVLPAEFFDAIPRANIVYGALLPFLIAGAVLTCREDFHVLIYTGLTLLLLIVWPEQDGLRYMFPLLPFITYFSYRGMHASASRLREPYRSVARELTRAAWMAILAAFVVTSLDVARANVANQRAPEDGPFDRASTELFDWIRAHTAPQSVVIFHKPRAMRMMTARNALLIDMCEQLGRGNYVVLRTRGYMTSQVPPDRVTTCNPSLDITPTFENQRFNVYRISPKS